MATKAKAAQADLEEILDEADLPPESPGVVNINKNTHVGYSVQRPHAALEDRLARTAGWTSFEQMKAAGAQIKQDESGDWYREVPRHTGFSATRGGKLYHQVELQRRPVALSIKAAQGARADYWNGVTWVRNGFKPEGEAPENRGTSPGAAPESATQWVEADAADQAAAKQAEARVAANTPVPPELPADGGTEE